jgi:organic radical activating enzyme
MIHIMVKCLTVGKTMHDNYEFFQGGLDGANSYTLYVTYKCNWFCNYCSEDTHNRNIITFEEIKRKVESLPDNSDVAITGGEPGILKPDVMSWILNRLIEKNCFINVNTNGTFFKKHRELCHIPNSFLYHCSEHLEEPDIWIPEHVDKSKIDFQLVITDDTMHRLEYYVNKYPDIKFLVFAAGNVIGKGLSRANGFNIYKEYKDRINPDSYLHLITTCQEVNVIKKLKALR